jgi:NAD(P)-dependent dehydrogenase (short-subunit alcohol dehydrogenase family)
MVFVCTVANPVLNQFLVYFKGVYAMSHRLENNVAIITGANRGIGLEIAKAYAREGASLFLIARNQLALDQVAQSLETDPSKVVTHAMDVTNRDACFAAVAQAQKHFGHIDTLVNNAGIYRSKPFLEFVPQDFADMMDVNFYGVLHLTQACLPQMLERKKGSIVNIASIAGKWGSRNQSAYNVSKHAVVGLTRCLALEAGSHQVRVNAICPGFVETDMFEVAKSEGAHSAGISADDFNHSALSRTPLGRFVQADEVASMAVFLASKEGAGMTGQSISMDGGIVLS